MNFDINEVLNSIFKDTRKELDNLYSTADAKHSEYLRTFAPDVAEQRWSDLKKYHQGCKDSIIRTGTRKLQEALAPIRDYWNKSLSEFDLVLIERVSGIAALSRTETEFNSASKVAGNSYWALVALSEKAPDEYKDRIARPDIEQYRFLLDGLENRIERTLANYEGSGTFIDSAAQIANVDARTMPLFIQQAVERIDGICPSFFSFQMYAEGKAVTPGEKERIARIAEEEFSAPACAPGMIGNSILNYLEVHPEDESMIMRSEYGPAARSYAEEYGEARRINRLNRAAHTVVVSTIKK